MILSGISGYKKGLILTTFSLGSYIIAFITARLYYPQLAHWIRDNNFMIEGIKGFIQKNIETSLPTTGVLDKTPQSLGGLQEMEGWGIPGFLQDYLIKQVDIQTYADQAMDTIIGEMQQALVNFFINIISMVILFIVVRTLILLIGHLIHSIFEIPVLHTVNNVGGGVVGLIRGMVFIFIAVLIMIPIAMTNLQGKIAVGLEGSRLLSIFSHYLLTYILSWL